MDICDLKNMTFVTREILSLRENIGAEIKVPLHPIEAL
jgi:hypothetical protein